MTAVMMLLILVRAAFRPHRIQLVVFRSVLGSAAAWILGRSLIAQFHVLLFLCHRCYLLNSGLSDSIMESFLISWQPRCGINRSAVRPSSEVAVAPVMMFLIFVRSAFGSGAVEVVVLVMTFAAAARILLRFLITEFQALLFFRHCLLASCLWFVVVCLVSPDRRI
jgi:hypothetical protein